MKSYYYVSLYYSNYYNLLTYAPDNSEDDANGRDEYTSFRLCKRK